MTDRVSYIMRNVTKRARKNYLGIYDEMLDSVTGDEKYFPPLTESFTDAVIKSIDIDTKDIDVYSMNGSEVGAARVMKNVMRHYLNEYGFGDSLNQMLRYLAIDGHAVLKFTDYYDPIKKKRCFKIVPIDTLNLIVDQSADSLQLNDGILERSLLTDAEMRSKKGVWENVDAATKSHDFTRNPMSVGGQMVHATAPYYVVYDYWGQISKAWVTKDPADVDKYVEGHIVISSLGEQNPTVHYVELNKKGSRPYEDVPLQKVVGRWQGRGIPEKLFGTQKYLNALVNIRKKNAMILQQGLFKAKRGMGLTADSILSKITVGGIVQVDEMDDFQQLPVQDYRASSYQDEDRLMSWGERATGANDIRRGELAAASAPATASLIRDRNSKDLFQLVQENVGLMLERFLERNCLPWIAENVKDGEIVSFTGSLRDLEEFDNAIAEHLVNKSFVEYVEKNSVYPKPEEMKAAKEAQLMALRRQGTRRYMEVKKAMFSGEYGSNVTVTNETIDRGTILTKLQELLTLAVSSQGQLKLDTQGMLDTIFDMLNIPTDRIYSSAEPYKTPIDKMTPAQAKVAGAMASQPGNAVTGSVAPQQNSAVPESQSSQAMVGKMMQQANSR